jgi:D-cysteine desulfhydrase family pyridoxal phosphate-dependent enzyme
MPPAVGLAHLPTPLEPMGRLGAALGAPALYVKRDDCTGLALGGNKARKLEPLCAEAVAAGCDTLVTGGGPQSNHVRMTSAAANRLGLDCHVALAGDEPTTPSGNLLLDGLLGAHLHFTGPVDYYELESAIEALAASLARDGRQPFPIPVGGASVTGVAAYADAADELTAQAGEQDVDVRMVVVADGSGGTHAGLLAGLRPEVDVLGVDVGTRPDLDAVVPRLAAEAATRTGRPAPRAAARIDHDRFGAGYGALTDAAVEAIELAARLEGLVLDPVYTGKAMAGLVAAVREERVPREGALVFWHTGGSPALFAERYIGRLGDAPGACARTRVGPAEAGPTSSG